VARASDAAARTSGGRASLSLPRHTQSSSAARAVSAVRPAVPLAILHQLIRQAIDRLRQIPGADGPPQRPAPAARALHEFGEREQMRARARHLRQCRQSRPPRRQIRRRCRQREGEQRRVVLRRAAGLADLNDARHRPLAVHRDGAQHRRGVLTRQHAIAGIVAAAFGPEDQEAVQPLPVIDREGVAAGRVRHGVGDRTHLRRDSRERAREDVQVIRHGPPRKRESGGRVFAEGCYGALCGACGFEPPADRITLDLRPAGVMLWIVFMPGSIPGAAAVAVRIRVDVRADQRRNALVDSDNLVSRTASFRPVIKPGGHVIADGFLLLYPTELRRLAASAGVEPAPDRLSDNHRTPARPGQHTQRRGNVSQRGAFPCGIARRIAQAAVSG
jgi:hypothetical protein